MLSVTTGKLAQDSRTVGSPAEQPITHDSREASPSADRDVLEIAPLKSPVHLETDTGTLRKSIGLLISEMDIKKPGALSRMFSKGPSASQVLDRFLLQLNARCVEMDPALEKKHLQELQKSLITLWSVLYGKCSTADERLQLTAEICKRQVLPLLVKSMPLLDFESQKLMAQIVNNLVRNVKTGKVLATGDSQQEFLIMLVQGAQDSRHSTLYLDVLDVCMFREQLAARFVNSGLLGVLLGKVCLDREFSISGGAFQVLKRLLAPPMKSETCDRGSTAIFSINARRKHFFRQVQMVLAKGNYAQKIMLMDLLFHGLTRKASHEMLMAFIGDIENLKAVMISMGTEHPNLCRASYHIFKFFAAKTDMPEDIKYVLHNNRVKLREHFKRVQPFGQDERFDEEVELVLTRIDNLKPASI